MPKPVSVTTLLLVILFQLSSLASIAQQTDQQDSTSTPFRQGRWLTGLAGSISSSTSALDSAGGTNFTSQYSFNISNGKFIRNRWLVGFLFFTSRSNSEGLISRESESLFIGPSTTYYLSKLERGSVFIKFSPGYTRFRERVSIVQNGSTTQNSAEGTGVGSVLSLGYSHVIHDRIAFDLGVNLNLFWIGADRVTEPSGIRSSDTINVSDISFSFGFNVLLDRFFF